MLSVINQAKSDGKKVGFFIGNAQRKFDGQNDFLIDGIKTSDNKILLRYDGYYAPQTLLMHENVHIEWDNPEMQKAKDIILSDLSESEKKKLLSTGRYKDYLTLYNGDVDSVWEEFIADVFAGMNNYTSDYIDTVVDYWYEGKVIDRYDPAVYTESIDAGENAAVLGAIGFGNEYSLSEYPKNIIRYSPKGLKLPKAEFAKFKSSVSTNYYEKTKTHKGLQYQSSVTDKSHVLYIYEDGGFGEYNPVARIDYADFDVANAIIGVLRNDEYYSITGVINSILKTVEVRRSGYTVYNAYSKKRSSSRSNGVVSEGTSKPNAKGIDGGSSRVARNKRGIKYTLSSYDTDAVELTTERKKEIFEQYEKDRAGIEKPTTKQLWGERAAWVAHNMSRVFPQISERGERGTFFAEFRKMMIQWKNLPTTASFMVQFINSHSLFLLCHQRFNF